MAADKKYVEEQLKKSGQRIRALRKAKGFSSAEKFAYANDINRVQYGRYENGSDLRLSSFYKLLKALDVTPEEFFKEGFETEYEQKP